MKKELMFSILLIFVLGFALAENGKGAMSEENKITNEYTNQMGEKTANQTQEMQRRFENLSGDKNFNFTFEANKTKLRLKDGRDFEIKIMPETASLKAIAALRVHNCNESNNCTIELKETGTGNNTRLNYEAQIERHYKLLGLFQVKANESARIDAESGNTTSSKPWWSFLATSSN
jgi:hypothetical protein